MNRILAKNSTFPTDGLRRHLLDKTQAQLKDHLFCQLTDATHYRLGFMLKDKLHNRLWGIVLHELVKIVKDNKNDDKE